MAKALGGVTQYGEDTPIPLTQVLEICGFYDTWWALRYATDGAEREIRLLDCEYAEHVLPIFEARYPDDKRPRNVIAVSRRFANGEATSEELGVARAAAGTAARNAAGNAAGNAAARADAGVAAFYAERGWQTARLKETLAGG